MDDDYPNFSNAYPTTASHPQTGERETSWHPALRPDHAPEQPTAGASSIANTGDKGGAIADSDDDFFDRYPGATPKKQQQQQPSSSALQNTVEDAAQDHEEYGDDGGYVAGLDSRPSSIGEDDHEQQGNDGGYERRGSIAVHHSVSTQYESASMEELARVPSSHAEAEGPVKWHLHSPAEEIEDDAEPVVEAEGHGTESADREEDVEEPVFHPGESAQAQAQELEVAMPALQDRAVAVEEIEGSELPTDDVGMQARMAHPEARYEHQGEVTEMEAAVDEGVEASLLQDEEAPPTLQIQNISGNVEAESGVQADREFDEIDEETPSRGQIVPEVVAPPKVERSFTTNFTEPAAPSSAEDSATAAADMVHTADVRMANDAGVGDETHEPDHRYGHRVASDDKTFGELLGDDDDEPAVPAPDMQVAVPRQRPHAPDSSDWPSVPERSSGGDGDDFAELLGSQVAAQTAPKTAPAEAGYSAAVPSEPVATERGLIDATNALQPGDGASESAMPATEEDLAAAWQAALDDDEILDDDDDKLLDESNDLDPSKFFGDEDEDGFLLEEEGEAVAPPVQTPQVPSQQQSQQQRGNGAMQYRPQNTQQPQQQRQQSNPYAAPGPNQFAQSLSHGRTAGTPDTGLFDVYATPSPPSAGGYSQSAQQQRPSAQTAQSFADKSKGGYQSPYDLPMEVVKPRQRVRQPQQGGMQAAGRAQAPLPPPRTSSFGQSGPPLPGGRARGPSVSSLSPPVSRDGPPSGPPAVGPTNVNGAPASAKTTPKTDSGFFAELPVISKAKIRPSGAFSPALPGGSPASAGLGQRPGSGYGFPPRQGPAAQSPMGLPQAHPSRAPAVQAPQPPAPPLQQQQQQSAVGFAGLRQPERMPLLPDTPPAQQPTQFPAVPAAPPPATQTRYSPAPVPQTQPTAAAASRYSPAPAAQPGQAPRRAPSMQNVRPFAPRTSSPLASFSADKTHPPLPAETTRRMTTSPPMLNGATSLSGAAGVSPERKVSRYSPSEPGVVSPASHSQASFAAQAPPLATQAPPQRPRTQSPGATMKQPRIGGGPTMAAVPERPMSTTSAPGANMRSFVQTTQPSLPNYQQAEARQGGPVLPHRRQFSRDLAFAAPQDERSRDPLERWKGHPIFHWSAGGAVITSFPKRNAFYGAQGVPSVKCTPGDIKVQDIDTVLPLAERDAKFPGPLPARSRGKKKEVLAWLTGKIEELERRAEGAMLDFNMPADMKKRNEEKVVLCKLMKIFVEHDGVLEGNPKIDEEVRNVLLPNLARMSQVVSLQTPTSASTIQSEPVDKSALLQLRQALLEGKRDQAVFLAEEKKLWGHAMLISSTMGPEVWRSVIASFVRSQVKSFGSDARSLATLYQVFAGNSEECVDELVPPSARAGFQMVSKSDDRAVAGNPLEGLDQWRETVGLVVGNRTANDGASLVALGKLLASYGRAEAAGVCWLFARREVKVSGADDAEANFVLLGANSATPDEIGRGNEVEAIQLTEIYEWASSLSAPTTAVSYLPHLQAYKLLHAQILASYGMKTKAQAYCDHITSTLQSSTRTSAYYHPMLAQSVADLSAFLSQTPQDSKGGFFSKPAMKNVSSGAASWFSKFVAGEEDRESNGSGPGAGGSEGEGPFGRLSGEISRSGSGVDLYGSMMGGGAVPTTTGGQGFSYPPTSGFQRSMTEQSGMARYAPAVHTSSAFAGGFQAQEISPTEVTRSLGVPSLEQQRPASARSASSRYAPTSMQQQPPQGLGVQQPGLGVPRPEVGRAMTDYAVAPYGSSASRRGSAQDPGSQGSYEPSPSLAQEPSPYAYQPPEAPLPPPAASEQEQVEDPFARPPAGPDSTAFEHEMPDAEAGGYEPPTAAYEPPTYQPYQPEPEAEEEESAPKPKKKTFMDDDDDDADVAARAAALKKAQADREADEAFRKAAEADAARDNKGSGKGGSWLGGWFKKDPSAELNKPIKAKLGEESSFYYDENLKKWVNKKGGSEAATPVAATPPPPKGTASRAVSAAMGPPSGPPSRVASASGMAPIGGGSRPPTSGSMAAPPMMGGGSGPPSRAGTPMSVRSDAAPALTAAEGVNGGPPSRPPTSMSTASSLDDLMAGPRKAGGTVKGKKKGRYVDVMAK